LISFTWYFSKFIVIFEIIKVNKLYGYRVNNNGFSHAHHGEVILVKVDADNPQIIYPDVLWTIDTEGYDKNLTVKNLEGK
jgi:hypothetical protein